MKPRTALVAFAALLTLGSVPVRARSAPSTPGAPTADARRVTRVMTYNILHDGVRTLMRPWPTRRPLVASVIRSARPDVVCLQEVSPRQLHDLSLDLPEYRFFPGGLTGGTSLPKWAGPASGILKAILGDFFERGEHCPILVRRGFGSPVDSATFPLSGPGRRMRSPTPHVVNAVRIELSPGRFLDVFNTHLGHMPGSGHRTADALFDIADGRWNGGPQIVAGDFNAMPFSGVVCSLTKRRSASGPPFEDAFTQARSRSGGNGTFHWGLGLPGPRLDYVFVRPPCAVDRVIVAGKRIGGTLPSDHYAAVVDLRVLGAP